MQAITEKFEYISEYSLFLIREAYNQELMKEQTNLILEGTGQQVIYEASIWENIKNFVSNIMKKIANFFAKFMEYMNKLFRSDKGYLERYKDIILAKTPVETEFTDYYNYNINLFLHNLIIPALDLNPNGNMIKSLVDEGTFTNQYFGNFMKDKNSTLADNIKSVVRGPALSVKSTDDKVNFRNMFDYCYTYESDMKPNIKKDQNTLNNASAEVQHSLDDLIKEAKNKENQENVEKTNNTTTTSNNTNNTEESKPASIGNTDTNVKKESAIVNSFDYYFNELSIGSTSNGSGSTASIGDINKMPGKNIQNLPNQNVAQTVKDNTPKNGTSEEYEAIKSTTSTYFNVCASVVATKLTLAQEIYKAYMSIIRWHVREYVGKGNDGNTTTSNQTNYNNNDNNTTEGKYNKLKNAASGILKSKNNNQG